VRPLIVWRPFRRGGPMARSLRTAKVTALVATLLLVATACSKSSNTPSSPIYDVFAQKFRFHGMPATIIS
jgi:hypothetical protein